jgi:hypothetical protein
VAAGLTYLAGSSTSGLHVFPDHRFFCCCRYPCQIDLLSLCITVRVHLLEATMNVLHSILKVSFVPVAAGENASGAASQPKGRWNKLKVVSRQFLRFRLTITYDNEAGDVEKEKAARAFLAMVGFHSLEAAWTYLFSTVQLVPFFVSKPDASSDLVGQRAVFLQRTNSSPPSPAPHLLNSIGNSFVFGTPVFWSNHTYTCANRAAEPRDYVYGLLRGSSPTDTFTPTTLPSFVELQSSMPYVTTTASPSFSNNGNLAPTPRGGRGSRGTSDATALGVGGGADVRCEVIGTVKTVSVGASGFRVSHASEANAVLPRLLESTFTVELALPDLETASWSGLDTTLAMVVLLPLSFDYTRSGAQVDPGQPSILRSVLARSLGQTHVEMAASSALVLGSGVVPVEFAEPFLCFTSTSPLSNDRLVLNLSLTNVTASAARLYSTSLDLHSSCVLRDGEGGDTSSLPKEEAESHFTASPLWGELRPGANLSSMRTIDLLTKLVTLTPVVVGEERPPFILHPGETYTFEFVIEVLPQLCYLLNSRSLEYVYERYYAVPHGMTSNLRFEGGGGGAGNGERPGDGAVQGTPSSSRGSAATAFSKGSVVTDCYGEVVSANELRSLLSYSYVSHLFVYYDLVTEGDATLSPQPRADDVAGHVHGTGLYLRYPAKWSFGA